MLPSFCRPYNDRSLNKIKKGQNNLVFACSEPISSGQSCNVKH